MINNKSKYCSF